MLSQFLPIILTLITFYFTNIQFTRTKESGFRHFISVFQSYFIVDIFSSGPLDQGCWQKPWMRTCPSPSPCQPDLWRPAPTGSFWQAWPWLHWSPQGSATNMHIYLGTLIVTHCMLKYCAQPPKPFCIWKGQKITHVTWHKNPVTLSATDSFGPASLTATTGSLQCMASKGTIPKCSPEGVYKRAWHTFLIKSTCV